MGAESARRTVGVRSGCCAELFHHVLEGRFPLRTVDESIPFTFFHDEGHRSECAENVHIFLVKEIALVLYSTTSASFLALRALPTSE